MLRNIIMLLLLLTALSSNSQKFEMGKVSVKELQEARHPADTAAPAAILYKKGKTNFLIRKDVFSVVHEIEFRLKIYKKEGLVYATYEIPYFIGYENLNPDYVTLNEAATYNLEGGKIVKTKLGGEGKFKQKINSDFKTLAITLPNVKEGSVIEFKYTIKSEDIGSFPNFTFQGSIPYNYVQYKTEVPVAYKYKIIRNGIRTITTESKVGTEQQSVLNQHNQYDTMSYKQFENLFEMRDVPALREEPYVDHIYNYQSSIDHELEAIQWDDVPEKSFSKSWDDISRLIYEDKNFGKQLNERNFFEDDIRKVITPQMTKQEKISAVFKFAQSTLRWNGEYRYLTDKGLKAAYISKTGNAAEINLLLVSFFNAAGIISTPVLLSTVGNGIAGYPNRRAFNYVVASIEHEGKIILFDATNPHTAPGILPLYALNWTGRRIHVDGSSDEIVLQPAENARFNAVMLTELLENGQLSGQARITRTGHSAYVFREQLGKLSREQYLEDLENSYGGARVSSYERSNLTLTEEPIVENFNFVTDNIVDITGGKIYINPLLFFARIQNPFISEKRELPIFFGYPKAMKYSIRIKIPDGYMVESLPEAMSVSTGEGVAAFRYSIQQQGDQIQLMFTSDTNKMLVAAEFYTVLRDYFAKYTSKQAEKVVLKKI